MAGLEAAERREVDARALGDLPEGQPPLRAQLPESSADAGVEGLLVRICLPAAGDLTVQAPSVANAVTAGNTAAAMIVGGLMAEAHGLAPVGASSTSPA